MENFKEYLSESRAIDLFVAYRFLRILTTTWEDQEAFKHGIIDKDGKLLRKANTLTKEEEKKSFTLLHRLVFNLKRILHKIPGVRTKIGTYATALYLLKQHFASEVEEDDTIEIAFRNWLVDNGHITEEELDEAVTPAQPLGAGRYSYEGDTVVAYSACHPVDKILGQNIYQVVSESTGKKVYVTLEDLHNGADKEKEETKI